MSKNMYLGSIVNTFKDSFFKKILCVLLALSITSCGEGGGGSSSTGGGNMAIGGVGIGLLALWLLKQAESNPSTANSALEEITWQFSQPKLVKTLGSIGFAALSSRSFSKCQKL
jgi:Na+/phosphate symporter